MNRVDVQPLDESERHSVMVTIGDTPGSSQLDAIEAMMAATDDLSRYTFDVVAVDGVRNVLEVVRRPRED